MYDYVSPRIVKKYRSPDRIIETSSNPIRKEFSVVNFCIDGTVAYGNTDDENYCQAMYPGEGVQLVRDWKSQAKFLNSIDAATKSHVFDAILARCMDMGLLCNMPDGSFCKVMAPLSEDPDMHMTEGIVMSVIDGLKSEGFSIDDGKSYM